MKINKFSYAALFILILAVSFSAPACVPAYIQNNQPKPETLTGIGIGNPIKIDFMQQARTQAPLLPSIADVVEAVKPSVVAINTEVNYKIFRRSFTEEGAGSGWIIDPNGTIVTNSHVLAGADTINVTLADGRTFKVDLGTVATDPANDLAVLRIDADNLPVAPIGNSSQLRVGDWVVAIGNPLGLGISAKEGIVSRLKVSLDLEEQKTGSFIETSAAINPGNSGGPLVNMRGEVIGITSVKIGSVGIEGLGYAISINEAMPKIKELLISR